jgi:hypothetical protein
MPAVPYARLLRDGVIDRLDPEYFDSTRLAVEEGLREAGGVRIGDHFELSEDRVNPRDIDSGSFEYVEIRNIDTRDGFVAPERLDAEDAPSRARMALVTEMVGLSSVRPARSQAFIVTPDLDGGVGTTGLILLRKKRKGTVRPALLFAALKTSVVIDQLDRRSRASMYPTVYPPDVNDVVLPPVADDARLAVEDQVERAYRKRNETIARAKQLAKRLESYFDRMGPSVLLGDLGQARPTTRRSVDLRADGALQRIDAEFHAAAFDALLERMTASGPTKKLGDLVSEASTGHSASANAYRDDDPGGGVAVIKVGALTGLGINWTAIRYVSPDELVQSLVDVRDGDVLFTSTAHQPKYMAHKVDVVTAVPSEISQRITFVGELMRLRIRDQQRVPPEYLAAFLRSPLGREQIRRCIRGISSHVYPNDVKQIIVPIPRRALITEIASEVRALQKARHEYTRLMRSAVDLVQSEAERALK